MKDMGPMASLGRGVWGSRGLQGSNQPRVHRTLSGLWVVAFCCSWTGCCVPCLPSAHTAQLKLMCVQAVCETPASVPVTWKCQRVLVLGSAQLRTGFNLEKEKAVRVRAR